VTHHAATGAIVPLVVAMIEPHCVDWKGDRPSRATIHSIVSTMTTTIDAAGRLVIPGPIRREAALEPGVPLEVRWRDGIIEIEPQPIPVALEKHGRLLVAKPKVRVRPLGTAAVERTRRDISTGRGRR
jgi:AbrB family looped-hinge helix DNA binding protein